jgi:hypothetical protein
LLTCIAEQIEYVLVSVRENGVYYHLQDRYKLFDDTPALIVKLILPQLQRLVCCNTINWLVILKGKQHHIMG